MILQQTLRMKQTDDEMYKVAQPLDGAIPTTLSFTMDGKTFHFSDFSHTERESQFQPNVLVYEELSIEDE